jgi:putative hydrolase of the HAD superfamily
MPTIIRDIIRRHSHPTTPQPTGWRPVLQKLPHIKAVLFDIYGTLFVSGSPGGESAELVHANQAIREALVAVGWHHDQLPHSAAERLVAIIGVLHAAARKRGISHPEVDIEETWRLTLRTLEGDASATTPRLDAEQIRRLAVEFECRTNPVWPMPHAAWCLTTLHEAGLKLGVLSNAQFYTKELFPALLGGTPGEFGMVPELQFYSFEFGCAKPGLQLHLAARAALGSLGIRPEQTLCVGNDMANDIATAVQLGFRTALFAGDQHSLRADTSFEGDTVTPDIILTDLAQIPYCVLHGQPSSRDDLPWQDSLWGDFASRAHFG